MVCCVGYTLLRSLCLKQEAVGPYGDDLVLGRVLEGHADLGIPSLGLEVLFSIEELMSGEQEVVLRERCDTTAYDERRDTMEERVRMEEDARGKATSRRLFVM